MNTFKINGRSGRYAQVVMCSTFRGGETVAVWRFSDGKDTRYVSFICDSDQWQSEAFPSAGEALEAAIDWIRTTDDLIRESIPLLPGVKSELDQPVPRRRRSVYGFTIVELIVSIVIIGLLAAAAVVAYGKVVNTAKVAKSADLVSVLGNAKSMFVSDPQTTTAQITSFNTSTGDTQFGFLSPYVRVNNTVPQSIADLLTLEQMPAQGVTIGLGTVDDSAFGGTNTDTPPTVTGYP
jgi:prepilin-type N-terminal cleavage/methylation domain-containing protein